MKGEEERCIAIGMDAYLAKPVSIEQLRVTLEHEPGIVMGYGNQLLMDREIGEALNISEGTVKIHISHLFEKLGATSRTEAVKIATRRGLVRLD